MPFPEFDNGKKKILFFSRGRGRGHAIPDIEIIRAWLEMRNDIDIRVVSYGSGAVTFAEVELPLIDIGLPETSPIAEMSVLAGKLIGWLNPDLVVSHEEFAVAPAAKIFRKPVIFITNWFTEPEMYSMNALKFADEILFIGRKGIFDEPEWVQGKVKYLGPFARTFRYTAKDRIRAREELSIEQGSFVVSVFPGSWTETLAPTLDLIANAFDTLDRRSKKLIWVAGDDFQLVRCRLSGRQDALVIDWTSQIDQFMVATDVAITKSSCTTAFELSSLRIPTLSLSFELNPMDDRAIHGWNGIFVLPANATDCGELASAIEAVSGKAICWETSGSYSSADQVASLLDRSLTAFFF